MTAENDEATGRLLVAAALHDGMQHGGPTAEAAQWLAKDWERTGRLEGMMYGVVMQYALEHATPEDQQALRRWFTEVTAQ
ncbi:hypothetical protein KVH31_34500 [Streptomyces olivaceus]|uniref:hypothetical protein n=1 Tax=Streptomyces olivaceus TaxID=47716 RepID=UPI001CCCFE82|nr:hypothetical protein [Streptomyces olivaceus]MBZ6211608.1 hypothetical protein [Streptomyces olivaceus]